MRQSPDSWWQPPLAPSLLSSYLRRPVRDSNLHLSFPKASRREPESAGNSPVLERTALPAGPELAPVWKAEPDTPLPSQLGGSSARNVPSPRWLPSRDLAALCAFAVLPTFPQDAKLHSMHSLYNRVAGQSVERLAALSDGIFAVAMTLLVLDLHVPARELIHSQGELWHTLAGATPQLISYMMSFMTLGIFWNGQQSQLNSFTHSDRHLSWIHIAFLFLVSVMPFSTRLLA